MSHTPGPWKYGFESVAPEWAIVTTSGGAIIANVNDDSRQEANARLIAAAPAMLQALEDLLKEVHHKGLLKDVNKNYSLLLYACQADKAIALAKGQEQAIG